MKGDDLSVRVSGTHSWECLVDEWVESLILFSGKDWGKRNSVPGTLESLVVDEILKEKDSTTNTEEVENSGNSIEKLGRRYKTNRGSSGQEVSPLHAGLYILRIQKQ